MTTKMPKPVYQILFAVMVLTFTAIACNNKKSESKKTEDSTSVKPSETNKMDTSNMDTASVRPVKTPD